MLNASAYRRRSLQCVRDVVGSNRNERGKTVEKPIDVRPLAVLGKKSVKLPVSCTVAQPPLGSEISPLQRELG
jgi:hypothetical protein